MNHLSMKLREQQHFENYLKMTQNGGKNFDSSSRALGAFDQRGPYGILIHLGVDFLKMNESQFRAENPAAKYPLPYSQQLLRLLNEANY